MAAAMFSLIKLCLLCISVTIFLTINHAKNTLGPSQVFKNGHTLISHNKRFELGFFDTRDPSNRYLGIWYRGIKPLTVVWVANRATPLRGINVRLHMNSDGDLILEDDQGNVVRLSRLNHQQHLLRSSLVLLDSGNLVLVLEDAKNETDKRCVWQSFDFPSDTLLPGMKLGWDLQAQMNRVLKSWSTSENPFPGDFVFRIESHESPQLLLEQNGATGSRWGPWNGKRFSGTTTNIQDNPVFRTVYHYSSEEVYFTFEMVDHSVLLRLVVTSFGAVQFLKWRSSSGTWVPMMTLNKDVCDRYGSCGPYGICYADDPGCHCLKGFVANSPHDWRSLDCTDGCRRNHALNCSSNGDGFVKYTGIKLPDKFTVWPGLSSKECEDHCFKECNCMAYANVDIYGNGRDCVVWLDKLIDVRYSGRDGDELYVRTARVDLDSNSLSKSKKHIVIISSLLSAAFLGAALWWATSRYRSRPNTPKKRGVHTRETVPVKINDDLYDDRYIQSFDMKTISAATNNLSPANKIGQGGFGPVYEGELQNGQKIAVKRLSEHSTQGLAEFKNEVHMIEQLQHRNLIKLLGCCIQGDERMLVYEYMPNKSLDQFIFAEPAKKSLLPWEKRMSILRGVAKGLDYLHFGSRTRVIHRDLKASNILLDNEMNPIISDFGLAKNSENEKEETTKRVIGTYGYMSPEYMMDGSYSTRSDVFSFGVLVLEMISGQKNWGFHHPEHDFNLLGHAWKLLKEGRQMEVMDPVLEESFVEIEVTRCIQVGLLCVQNNSDERPIMSRVVCMLENENLNLPEPGEPGFFSPRVNPGFGLALPWTEDHSVNGLTVTELTARS